VSDELFSVLSALGLSYDKRTTARGRPYAGFQLVGAPGSVDVRLTALLEDNVLHLTSHGIATSATELEIVTVGAALPLGAAYRSPEGGDAELSIGVFVGDVPPTAELASALLEYAVRATAALASGGPTPQRPRYRGSHLASGDIEAALGRYGHHPTAVDGGITLQIPLSPELSCAIVIGDGGDGWIVATASYAPEQVFVANPQSVADLQKLQRWATAGRFLLDSSRLLGANVSTPLVAEAERCVVWTTSQCVALLQTAARHLHLLS